MILLKWGFLSLILVTVLLHHWELPDRKENAGIFSFLFLAEKYKGQFMMLWLRSWVGSEVITQLKEFYRRKYLWEITQPSHHCIQQPFSFVECLLQAICKRAKEESNLWDQQNLINGKIFRMSRNLFSRSDAVQG